MGRVKSFFFSTDKPGRRLPPALGWALSGLCLSLAVYAGRIVSGDGWAYFFVALKLLAGHPPTLPPDLSGWAAVGLDGLRYSKHGLGFSLLLIPFLFVGSALQFFATSGDSLEVLQDAALLIGPIMGAIGTGVFYRVQRKLGFPRKATAMSTLFFLCGGLWLIYTRYLFTELTVGVMILLMILGGLEEGEWGDWMTGTASAFLILLRVDGVLLVGPVVAVLIWKRRRWYPYVLPLALGCGLVGFYNWYRFGLPWSTGMGASPEEQFSTPLLLGLFGQFFAAGNGLFLYAPYLVIPCTLLLILMFRGDISLDPFWLSFLLGGAAYLVLHSKWYSWMGGWSWGPRRMIPLLPLFHLVVGRTWNRMGKSLRFLMVGLLLTSVLINIGGLAGDYRDYYRDTFYQSDVLFSAANSQIVRHNQGLLTGEFPIHSFWLRVMGPVAGGILVVTWLVLGTGLITRVWPESS